MYKLKSFIEQAPVCLAFLDKDLKISFVSPKFILLLETTAEVVIDKPISTIFRNSCEKHPSTFPKETGNSNSLSGKEILKNYSGSDEKEKVVKWELSEYKDSIGLKIGYLLHLQKISSVPTKTSEKIRRGVLLDTILDTVETGLIACDKNGRITVFNRAAREWHGLPKKDIPPEEFASFYNLYEPDEETLFSTEKIPLVQVLREDKIEHPYMFIQPKNGKKRHIKCNGSRIYGKDENIIGAVVVLYDVTEKKENERKLALSEKIFRGSFENSAVGMALTGIDGSCLEVNKALSQIMGYDKKQLKDLKFQDVTHPDDLEEDLNLFRELLEGKKDSYQLEKRAFHSSGKVLDLFLSVSIVRDHFSQPQFVISQILDISEKKDAERKIQSIAKITEDQNKRLKNFAHIVSHNLRSHSGNIVMLLELLEEENPQVKDNEFIRMIKAASDNLQETIHHLNDVSLLNTSDISNMEPINLRQVVESTLNGLSALLIKEKVKVQNEIPEDLRVMGLPAYLESIILNLTSNAIKYRSKERRPTIKFAAKQEECYIEFTIEDNGLGINLEKYGSKLFGMFKTFHKNEDAKGIGLFLTKNQIEALGGKIILESIENKGTYIKVYFKDAEYRNSVDY